MKIQKSADGFDNATITLTHPNCCGECPFYYWDDERDTDHCFITHNWLEDCTTTSTDCPLGWK